MADNLRLLFGMFTAPIVAGMVIAVVASIMGVFVILKRVVFIGIALSEVAALGIACGLTWGFHPFLGAGLLTTAVVAILARPFELQRVPRDAILGVVFVFASSASILLVARSGFGLHEVRALLYGDLILTSPQDLRIILFTLVPSFVCLLVFFRPILYTFLDREGARVLGLRVVLWELLFFFALGLVVAASSKAAGALLVFCYLVVTPTAALLLHRRMMRVVLTAVVMSLIATSVGLYLSVSRDLPTNQIIALAACGLFGLAALARGAVWMSGKRVPRDGSCGSRSRARSAGTPDFE